MRKLPSRRSRRFALVLTPPLKWLVNPGLGFVVLVAALLAACSSTPPVAPDPPEPLSPELSERTLTDYTGWWWLADATEAQVDERIAAGFRIVDVEVLDTDPWRFTVAMVADAGVHEKDWQWIYGPKATAEFISSQIDDHDLRIIDLETYVLDGQRLYTAVLVPNDGAAYVPWWWYLATDLETIEEAVNDHDARIVDLHSYLVGDTRYWNAVMYQNTGDNYQDWWWYIGASIEFLVDAVNTHGARVTALERLGDDSYAAVMVANPSSGWRWFFDIDETQVSELSNLYSVRVIDLEPVETEDGLRFDAIMLENGRHCDFAEERTSAPLSDNEIIDRAVQAEMCAQGLIGLAVGVVRDGRIVYLKGYGFENAEQWVGVEAKQSMFRWASVSKTVTGLATAQSALLDGLALDADVRLLVPEYPLPATYAVDANEGTDDPPDFDIFSLPPGAIITPRMLVSNTSGVKHYDNGPSGAGTPPASLRNDPAVHTDLFWAGPYFWDDPDHLVAIPGSEYSYSSYGFNLAGMAVARAAAAGGPSPLTFWEKVRDRIAIPFGMTPSAAAAPDYPPDGFASGTFFQPDHEWVEVPRRAVGYQLETVEVDDDEVPTGAIVQSGSSDVSWKLPSGGFISTVEQLAMFCDGLMNDASITDALRDMIWSPTQLDDGSSSNYGMGFSIGSRNGRDLMSHSGAQQKTRTNMYIYPNDGTCFVVMTNSEWADSSALVQALEDAYRAAYP